MATVNLGRVRPVYKGAYSATATYVALDRMTYTDGNLYEAVTNVPTGTAPSAGTSDSYWTLIGSLADSVVHKTGNESIDGVKTFSLPIKCTASVSLANTVDSSIVRVEGGSAFARGAMLELFGQDNTMNTGGFSLLASKNNDGTYSRLAGSPEGRLSWDSNKVLTGADVINIGHDSATNNDMTLPSGGTWKYIYSIIRASDGVCIGATSGQAAGSTVLSSYPHTSYTCRGIAIRVSD